MRVTYSRALNALVFKHTKKVGANDSVRFEGTKSIWRYHSTDIVTIDWSTRIVMYSNGGWHTQSTTERLNAARKTLAYIRPKNEA